MVEATMWQHLLTLISSTFYLTFFPDSLAHIFSNCFSDSCNELSTCQSHEKLIVVYISGGTLFLYWTIKKGKDQILFDSSIKIGAPKYISIRLSKKKFVALYKGRGPFRPFTFRIHLTHTDRLILWSSLQLQNFKRGKASKGYFHVKLWFELLNN